MGNISDNLKDLRRSKGLTQEDVAIRIHLTRQAISNYESGKTHPGIDILQDLADVYGVGIEDILYGSGKQKRAERSVRAIAICAGVLFAAVETIKGICLCLAHTVYAFQTGLVPSELMNKLEIHNKLIESGHRAELFTAIVPVLFFCMLIMCAAASRPIGWKIKAAYFACLAILVTVIDMVFSVIDPQYPFSGFYLSSAIVLLICLGLTVMSVIIDGMRVRHVKKNI